MIGLGDWLHVVNELMRVGDVAACASVLTGVGGSLAPTRALVVADEKVEEALSYAGVR
jgi:hypothetical protein